MGRSCGHVVHEDPTLFFLFFFRKCSGAVRATKCNLTGRRSTNAHSPVDKPTRNNGGDRLIYLLNTRRNSPNLQGHGSSTLCHSLLPYAQKGCQRARSAPGFEVRAHPHLVRRCAGRSPEGSTSHLQWSTSRFAELANPQSAIGFDTHSLHHCNQHIPNLLRSTCS